MRLQNKVAVITGAGTGIGEAIAQKFPREGARLVLSGLPADPVQDVADAITNADGRAVVHLGDLAVNRRPHPRCRADAQAYRYPPHPTRRLRATAMDGCRSASNA